MTDDERAAQQHAIAAAIRRAIGNLSMRAVEMTADDWTRHAMRSQDASDSTWAHVLAIAIRDRRINDALRQVLAVDGLLDELARATELARLD